MTDVEMTAFSAAQYLQQQLQTGLSYNWLLADMRRHRRECRLPFHRDSRGWALYYRSDLDHFIGEELIGPSGGRTDYLVERESGALASWLAPKRRIAPVTH